MGYVKLIKEKILQIICSYFLSRLRTSLFALSLIPNYNNYYQLLGAKELS